MGRASDKKLLENRSSKLRAAKAEIEATGVRIEDCQHVSRDLSTMLDVEEDKYGAALGNTREAWWAQLPLEPCLESFEQGELMGTNYGDSMIVVSAEGRRVVNEKESYNERGKVHFVTDGAGAYPNHLLFHVFDHAV